MPSPRMRRLQKSIPGFAGAGRSWRRWKRDRDWTQAARDHPFITGLGPGSVVLDVGANTGQFARAALDQGATVHSWEPNPIAFARLERLKRKSERFHTYEAAVSTFTGVSTLFVPSCSGDDPKYWSASGTLRRDKIGVDDVLLEVSTVDIRTVIRELGYVDVIKLDVEGLEFELLPVLLPLATQFGRVLVEVHGDKLADPGSNDAVLRELVVSAGLQHRIDLGWT